MIEKIIPTVHEWIQNIIFERDEDTKISYWRVNDIVPIPCRVKDINIPYFPFESTPHPFDSLISKWKFKSALFFIYVKYYARRLLS